MLINTVLQAAAQIAGMQVASGVVQGYLKYDSANDILSYAFSVSGLSFSPRVVALFANADWFDGYYTPGNINNSQPYVDVATLVNFNTNTGMRVILGFTNGSELSNLFNYPYQKTAVLAKTANGFVAEGVDVDETAFSHPVFNATYKWYAFG